MNHEEIVTQLSKQINPSEVIHAIAVQDVLFSIARRIGKEALTLTSDDLQLARDEVKEAIDHNLDIREYIDMGLDAWEITRKL